MPKALRAWSFALAFKIKVQTGRVFARNAEIVDACKRELGCNAMPFEREWERIGDNLARKIDRWKI